MTRYSESNITIVGQICPRRDRDAFITAVLSSAEIVPSPLLNVLVDVTKVLLGGYRRKAKKINTGRGNLTQET